MLLCKRIKKNISEISAFVFVLAAFLMIMIFIIMVSVKNVDVIDKRGAGEIVVVENIQREQIISEDAPQGCITEYSFVLNDPHKYDVCLAFYTIHQEIEVYIGDKQIYSLKRSDEMDMVVTAGTNWTVIPLYNEDIGKEICVRLTPAYKQFIDDEIEFLMGPQTQIIIDSLSTHLPVLLISGLAIVLGAILLILSIYIMWKERKVNEIFSYGIFAILLGLWRITDTGFSPFMNPEKPIFMFYVSVLSMMVGMIAMVKAQKSRTRANISDCYCLMVGVVAVLLMSLDLIDIIDIREVLTIVHIIMFMGLGIILINLIKAHGIKDPKPGDHIDRIVIWVLTAGAVGDAILFYTTGTSEGLIFTLIAFLVSTAVKGISIVYIYLLNEVSLFEKEKQIINSRATTMMGQIRSHFVFNVLNAISGMCKYDPEKADETVVTFSRYLRANVDLMQNDNPIPFDVVLNRLEDYIALEQIRFEDKINFVKDIRFSEFKMPALILQPIIENSIKHGITPKSGGGTITLETYENDENIFIKITDDGVGYDVNAVPREGSVGMENIRFRLDYFMKGTMDIKSAIGVGTTVTITMPKEG